MTQRAPQTETTSGEGSAPQNFTAFNGGDASQLQGHSLGGAHQPSKVPIEGYGTYDLGEVINFGATPSWIMTRWPRVTVGLAELDMQGYRVPLVTGTKYDDLAGSLTYYFDQDQRVKLIHFRGTTGDPRNSWPLSCRNTSSFRSLPAILRCNSIR